MTEVRTKFVIDDKFIDNVLPPANPMPLLTSKQLKEIDKCKTLVEKTDKLLFAIGHSYAVDLPIDPDAEETLKRIKQEDEYEEEYWRQKQYREEDGYYDDESLSSFIMAADPNWKSW